MAEPALTRDQTVVLDALHALARHQPISIDALSVLDETNLPFTDDEPLPDGPFQRPYLSYSVSALQRHYRGRGDVYADGDLFLYYHEADEDGETRVKSVAPDVMVVFGVENRPRHSYVLWREPKAPDFVMEIASASTWRRDRGEKSGIYASIGVREYFLYAPPDDPTLPATGRLDPPLQGYVLRGGVYERLPETRLPDGRWSVRSGVLGPCPCLSAEGELRWHDPATGEDLRTYDEAEDEREAAEAHAAQEVAARRMAEAHAAQEAAARRMAEAHAAQEAAARRTAQARVAQEAAARAELEALVEELRRGPGKK